MAYHNLHCLMAVILVTFATVDKSYCVPWIPEPQHIIPELAALTGMNFLDVHKSYVENSRSHGPKIRAVFIGDSLTNGYRSEGAAVWEQVWEPLGAVNYGFGGDRTENVLWRIINGEIGGINPKVVVLMIGVNNIWCNKTVPEIARGVTTIVHHLRKELPQSKVLLLGNAPGTSQPMMKTSFDVTSIVKDINALTSKLDDGGHIRFLDVTDVFYDKEKGELKKDMFITDLLHFSEEGYIKLYERMWPLFRELMETDVNGDKLPEATKEIVRKHPGDTLAPLMEQLKDIFETFDFTEFCKSTPQETDGDKNEL